VIWTENSRSSKWVLAEVSEAYEKDILTQILFDNTKVPFPFRQEQAADLRNWKHGTSHLGFDLLLGALTEIVGPSPLKIKEAEQRKAEEKRQRQEEEKQRLAEQKRKFEEEQKRIEAARKAEEERQRTKLSEIERKAKERPKRKETPRKVEDELKLNEARERIEATAEDEVIKQFDDVILWSQFLGFNIGAGKFIILRDKFRFESDDYGIKEIRFSDIVQIKETFYTLIIVTTNEKFRFNKDTFEGVEATSLADELQSYCGA
jgi:hypothetical protein